MSVISRASGEGDLVQELGVADFGDRRLSDRLGRLAGKLSKSPSLSLPKALDASELEAAYRFFRNEDVTPKRILEPHVVATVKRCASEAVVYAVHDTTVMSFEGRQELGPLQDHQRQGFFAHTALSVSGDVERPPAPERQATRRPRRWA